MSRRKRAQKAPKDNTIQFNEFVQKKQSVQMIPRSLNQEEYIDNLLNEDKLIVFATGPAGTGKTLLAVMAAIKAFKEGKVEKIVVTRPAVGVDDEKHGFLPGDLNAKMAPWTRPIFDVLEEYYSAKSIETYVNENVIEISPLAMMRGRTFRNSYIIADEVQNTTENQMKMLLTRIGENSKLVLTGDLAQTDIIRKNGLVEFIGLMQQRSSDVISHSSFDKTDVQRSEAVREVLRIYNDD